MTIDYLAHLRSESARFADVLADVDPATAVPTCPDWTVADLLHHLAEVQSFWAGILRDRPADEPDNPGPERPDDIGELRQLQRDATDALVAALDGADDTDPVWTWYDQDRSVGFIRRRQAHEALVHRWDAEIAAGVDQRPVEPELAADGVSEALGVMFGGCPEWATPTLDGPLGVLRSEDTGDEWWVRIGRFDGIGPQSGTVFTDEPTLELLSRGEAVDRTEGSTFEVVGSAVDLDAWLWGRPTLGPVRADGVGLPGLVAVIEQGIS